MSRQHHRLVGSIALLLCGGVGCILEPVEQQPEGLNQCALRVPGDYYLAALFPYEGKWDVGPALEAAVIQALDEINTQGGLHDGDQLGLLVCDTQGDPQVAATVAQEVKDFGSQVLAILGPVETATFERVARDNQGMPLFSIAADSPEINRIIDLGDYRFRMNPTDDLLARGAIQAATLQGNSQTVAIVHRTDEENNAFANALTEELELLDVSFIHVAPYEPGETGIHESILDNLIPRNPYAMFLSGFAEDAADHLRAAIERGYSPTRRWVLSPWLKQSRFLSFVDDVDYLESSVLGVGPSYTERQTYLQFAESYVRNWGEQPAVYADFAYDAAMVAAMAAHRASVISRVGVRDSLLSLFEEGTDGDAIRPGQWEEFRELGDEPFVYRGATGEVLFDEDGNRDVDVEVWGVLGSRFRHLACVGPEGEDCR